MSVLAMGAGCTTVQTAGPYIRNINLDSDGRVSSFERCTLIVRYVGDNLQIEGEDCQEVRPAKGGPPVPAAAQHPDAG